MTELTGSIYQETTAYDRRSLSGAILDWGNQPSVFREYPDQPFLEFGELPGVSSCSVRDAVTGTYPRRAREDLGIGDAAFVLHASGGVTAYSRHETSVHYYRSCPSAGALYPVELFCASRGVRDLEDGLYHFNVARFGLSLLRRGDFGAAWFRMIPEAAPSKLPSMLFFGTVLFFRSAWKYRKRAYRYCLLDMGHLGENLVLSLRALGVPGRWHADFQDDAVNRYVGLDGENGASLGIVEAGQGAGSVEERPDPVEPMRALHVRASALAPKVEPTPEIAAVHRATTRWNPMPDPVLRAPMEEFDWNDMPDERMEFPYPSFADTVRQRRSKRNFVTRSLARDLAGSLLRMVCSSGATDLFQGPRPEMGVVLGNVEGVASGFYRLDPVGGKMAAAREGDLRPEVARASLDQAWLRQSAMIFVFFADLRDMERRYGPRAYRTVLIKAGRLGQRVYLAATGLGMGACGIGAFFDGEVSAVLGLRDHEAPLYLVAAGPVKK